MIFPEIFKNQWRPGILPGRMPSAAPTCERKAMPKKYFPFLFLLLIFAAPRASALTGTAVLKPTSDASKVEGKATFEEAGGGLNVQVQITGAEPGKHGFHIHQFGSCEDAGRAAGGHYNPDNTPHGYLPEKGMAAAHAGDFGNIEIGKTGRGKLELMIPALSLVKGKYPVAGRAVILHEQEDDFSQPTGNAGGRIACGIIGISQE